VSGFLRLGRGTPARVAGASRSLADPNTSKGSKMPSASDHLVVVITGASSGIGRATAHAFARRGAAVVLAARREDMLREVERECVELGGAALAVPTDVTKEDEVEALGRHAIERFGGIDVWFNNAGVGIFGRFEDLPSDAWRRVIETNVFGYMHGAKVAMRQFRRQGYGRLIQNGSIVGRTSSRTRPPTPPASSPCAASRRPCGWRCSTSRASRSAPCCPR
jgi:NAD(P)-dependent dehydrogenase (short-subunit alcohol dehydrogenase family)